MLPFSYPSVPTGQLPLKGSLFGEEKDRSDLDRDTAKAIEAHLLVDETDYL